MTLPANLNPNLENYEIGAIITQGGRLPDYDTGGFSATRDGTLACWLENTTTTDGIVIFQNRLKPNSTPQIAFLPAKSYIVIKFTHLLAGATIDGVAETNAFSDPTVLVWGASGE
jgi:hypothetical protein